MNSHPSFYELDVFSLTGDPRTAAHVSRCEVCSKYLASHHPVSTLPSWAKNVTSQPLRSPWQPRWVAVAALATLGLTVMSRTTLFVTQPETRVKAVPSFALYVEHENAVRLWERGSPVETGDRLQLKVAGSGFRHLVVGSRANTAEGWQLLHEGPVAPVGGSTLPQSFLVDATDEVMTLGLLFCDATCTLEDLRAAASRHLRDEHRWFSEVVLKRKLQ